jgi:hypothetical protein
MTATIPPHRGFGVLAVNVHTPSEPTICRSPTSFGCLTRVPPNGRLRFRVRVSAMDFPDPLSTEIPICRLPMRWSSDSFRPLTCHLSSLLGSPVAPHSIVGISRFAVPSCKGFLPSKSPMLRSPTPRNLRTRVPLMDGSDLVGISWIAIPKCTNNLSPGSPISR